MSFRSVRCFLPIRSSSTCLRAAIEIARRRGVVSVRSAFLSSSQCIRLCRARGWCRSLERIYTNPRNPYRSFVHSLVLKRNRSNVSAPQARLLLPCRWGLRWRRNETRLYLPSLRMQWSPYRVLETRLPLRKFCLPMGLIAWHRFLKDL